MRIMEDQVARMADVPAPEPARNCNRGWFQPGDRRINREGRPRGSKVTMATSADLAARADRLQLLFLPERDVSYRLTAKLAFFVVNLPRDYEIVATRLDPA